MTHGTVIGCVAYETITTAGDKEYVRIGKLIYFRNHKGGVPSAQFRWDVVPAVAWKRDPDVYFIANFIPSEKIPEPPYLCGKMFVTTNTRGEHVEIGHINTRQRDTNEETQYYMQLKGLPVGVMRQQMVKAFEKAAHEVIMEHIKNETVENGTQILADIDQCFDHKAKSIFCTIEMD